MKSGDLIKYLLLAGGAYVLWEYVIAPMMTTAATAGTPSTIPVSTASTTGNAVLSTATQPIPATSMSANPLRSPLLTLANNPAFYKSQTATDANGNALMTIDEWNYAYAVVNGHADPNNPTAVASGYSNPNEAGTNYQSLVALTGSGLISVDQYLNALGQSGLGRIGGRSVIRMAGSPRSAFGGGWAQQNQGGWVN